MNVKVVESAEVTSNINPFNVLNQQNQNEEEAIEVGASNKMQQGGELINKVNLPKSQTNKKEVALEEADIEDGEITEKRWKKKSETNNVNKEEEGDDGSEINKQQLTIVDNDLELADYHIPLQIMEPKEDWHPLLLQGQHLKSGGEEDHNFLTVVCSKSQPVQMLHDMVSHQVSGEQQVAEFIENSAAEDKDEIDSLQLDNIVFKEAGLTPSTSSKLKGEGKDEILPTRPNLKRGTKSGSK
ncbi:hypothetical protein KY289_027064 [Solanum tuberosum]|nr:hypothetical protein KY289_027064 [Solanum tuberosum]KAH0661954.1 hypothetical protein KY284_026885 [Solanum tuberosum]